VIRDTRPGDAADIQAIYEPYVTSTAISFEEHPPDASELERRIAAALVHLVAERDGAVVGFAYAAPFHPRPAYRWSVELSIYLAEDARGLGVGGELLTALIDRARDCGMVNALALIALPNDASVTLFERHGFAQVGELADVGFKLGAWQPVGYWQLALREATIPPPPFPPSAHG